MFKLRADAGWKVASSGCQEGRMGAAERHVLADKATAQAKTEAGVGGVERKLGIDG